jgi:hypothetical protein
MRTFLSSSDKLCDLAFRLPNCLQGLDQGFFHIVNASREIFQENREVFIGQTLSPYFIERSTKPAAHSLYYAANYDSQNYNYGHGSCCNNRKKREGDWFPSLE